MNRTDFITSFLKRYFELRHTEYRPNQIRGKLNDSRIYIDLYCISLRISLSFPRNYSAILCYYDKSAQYCTYM